MGNRAAVVFHENGNISPAIYLHWNGGPESVYAFLAELDRRDVRADGIYDAARFVQIVGEHFDQDFISGYSLGLLKGPDEISLEGVKPIAYTADDNGVYVVDRTKRTKDAPAGQVRRFYAEGYGERIKMHEWSRIKVNAERRQAEKETKYQKIREFFEKNTKSTERQWMDATRVTEVDHA